MSRKKVIIVNNLLGYYGAENVLINMVNNLDQKKIRCNGFNAK